MERRATRDPPRRGVRRGRSLSHEACRIQQPPYPPELQPAERVFECLRGRIEGVVYGALDAKKEAVENELRKLAACREKVRSFTCWDWVEKALTQLAGKQATLR